MAVADKYDPAEFDDLHGGDDTHSTDLATARAEHEAAALHTFLSDMTSALAALRADSAARKVTDLERAKQDTEQRKAILGKLVDPTIVAAAAAKGAGTGISHAFDDFVARLTAALKNDGDTRVAVTRAATARLEAALAAGADRQSQFLDQIYTAENARQSLSEHLLRTWVAGGVGIALLVLLAGILGYWQGSSVGQSQGYAGARDEVAAASWANTASGKLARQFDLTNPALFGKMQDCDGQGWDKHRVNGRKACLPGSSSEGWWREKP